MDDTFNVDTFISCMNIFRHRTVACGLSFAEMLKSSQVRGTSGDVFGGILSGERLVAGTQHCQGRKISGYAVAIGSKPVEFDFWGIFAKPGICFDGEFHGFSNLPAYVGISITGKVGHPTMEFGFGRYRRRPIAAMHQSDNNSFQ